VFSVALAVSVPAAASAGDVAMDQVEKAILAEDWEAIANRLLKDVDVQTADPVLRLVKGHACLALNRNNESAQLFVSVNQEADLDAYRRWAARFSDASAHQTDECIRNYFLGDALARKSEWDLALQAFDEANRQRADHALVLNARGVVYAARGDLDAAVCDFDLAASVRPDFADVHANHGALNIQRRDGSTGALKAFNCSLGVSPHFALAMAGRACIHLVEKKFDAAKADFEEAARLSPEVAELVARNTARLFAHVGIDPGLDLASLSADELGTELAKSTTELFQHPTQGNFNDFISDLRVAKDLNPNAYGKALTEFNTALDVLPDFGEAVRPLAVETVAHNMDGGAAQTIHNLLPSGISIAGFGASGIDVAPTLEDTRRDNLALGQEILNSIHETLPNALDDPLGGVNASLAKLRLEDGNWPFVAYYGLCYTGKPKHNQTGGKEDLK